MYEEEHQTKRLFGTDSSMGLFVSLYLILLAFFIVLNSISNQQASRAGAVMESVTDTFVRKHPASADTPDPLNETQEPGPKDELLTDIEGMFQTEFALSARYPAEGGTVLEVTIPAAYLFVAGDLEVRSDRHAFLRDLTDVLSKTDGIHRQEVAFLFGSGEGLVSSTLSRQQELAVRRAGSLGRLLRSMGLEGGAYSTGFAPVKEGEIVALFRRAPRKGDDLDLVQTP